ncbi:MULTISPECIES: hypothetical protein [Streptomyces]|nr:MULTISPECIES: hypothetical protein [Streptomyces]
MGIALRIGQPQEKQVAAHALDGTPDQLCAVAKSAPAPTTRRQH